MNKDVIYIDVEDDITAIVSKVKASKQDIVALVPPKRIGVLQSAVNLRLLARAAKLSKKRLAIVTNNASLIALAGNAEIPVAKNLQSKPELAEIPAVKIDEDEDVIDGGELPIGEHLRQSVSEEDNAKEARSASMAAVLAEAPKANEQPKKPRVKGGPKVPNFDTFRKKLVLIIAGLVLLIGFLVWAIFIAPRATVVISAKTTSSSVNLPVTISTSVTTNPERATIKASVMEQTEDKNQQFTATGKKDAGSKATGTVNFSTSSFSGLGTIPAGTKLTSSSGLVFLTDNAVTLTYTGGTSSNGSTTITAAENGSTYNAATGSMSGAPSNVSATLAGPTSGGVSKTITIVTAEDVQKAKEALVDSNTDDVKAALKSKFGSDSKPIDESFEIDYGDVQTTPAIGQEATTSASLTTTITYRMYGVAKSELKSFLEKYNASELEGDDDQRVYDNGDAKATFQEAKAVKNGATATLIATAQIGPKIKDDEVKELAKGKRYGEIQEALESVKGIDAVDVKFFPFWVSTVPNDSGRITIEFNLER